MPDGIEVGSNDARARKECFAITLGAGASAGIGRPYGQAHFTFSLDQPGALVRGGGSDILRDSTNFGTHGELHGGEVETEADGADQPRVLPAERDRLAVAARWPRHRGIGLLRPAKQGSGQAVRGEV